MKTFATRRIEQTLGEFRAFLAGQRREPLVTVHAPPEYRQQTDADVMVEQACTQILADAAGDQRHVLPTFWPDFGTISTAKLWGGQILPAGEGGGIHIEPVARTLADLERLPAPLPFEQSDYQRAIVLHGRLCQRLASDQVFIRTPDFQGPMNTLALLMDQTELMCGLYEAPALIERALDHVTDTLIEYVGRFRRIIGPQRVIGNIWPYVSLPDGRGVSITQDYMPLLSPELYERFELPRLKRIADAFGGVFIHCCGEYSHHLPALARADFKIWGLEVHYPCTKIWDVYDALGDRVAYVPYILATVAKEYPSIVEFMRDLTHRPCAKARYWLALCSGWCDEAALHETIAGRFG